MSSVLCEVVNNIAIITLNNPKKRNMLDMIVCRLLVNAIKEAESDRNVVSVIILGPEAFSVLGLLFMKLSPTGTNLEQYTAVF